MPFSFEFLPTAFELRGAPATLRASTVADAAAWLVAWEPTLRKAAAPDATWDWAFEIERAHRSPGFLCVSVERRGRLEALMSVRTPEASRIERAATLLYVEYLGIAPWNRNQRELVKPLDPEITGLGTLLLGVAVRLSRATGSDGRIGLHSLDRPQTRVVYESRHLRSEGLQQPTDVPDVYFELPVDLARELERKAGFG